MSNDGLKHLGQQSTEPVNELDFIDWDGADVVVTLNCSEFTSRCPVTKQPDFGSLKIEYSPRVRLVETKSLKLYLWKYRDTAKFNESIVTELADDFYRQVNPEWVEVTGTFNTRGGIAVTASAYRSGT